MPTTVQQLFDYVGVQRGGVVRWGTGLPEPRPGVYVVSTNEDPADDSGLATAPVQPEQVERLLQARPELTVDQSRPNSAQLADRLRAMWPAGESVVYIGKATTGVATRVNQFYSTKIGARSPHAGGWPVKMLDTRLLWVHFGATAQSADVESKMVGVFEAGVPAEVRAYLVHPTMPLPYANLEYPDHRRMKAHGIGRAKAARPTRSASPNAVPGDPTTADSFDPMRWRLRPGLWRRSDVTRRIATTAPVRTASRSTRRAGSAPAIEATRTAVSLRAGITGHRGTDFVVKACVLCSRRTARPLYVRCPYTDPFSKTRSTPSNSGAPIDGEVGPRCYACNMYLSTGGIDLIDIRGLLLEGRWDALVMIWNAAVIAAGQHWWFAPLVVGIIAVAGRKAWLRLAKFIGGTFVRGGPTPWGGA